MKARRIVPLLLAMCAWPANAGFGAFLPAGSTVPLGGIAALPTGTVLAQSTQAFNSEPDSPTLTSYVFREDATTHLDFVYWLTFTSPPNFAPLISVDATGFAGFDTNAEYLASIDAPNFPVLGVRSIDGSTISFENWAISSTNLLFYAPLLIRSSADSYDESGSLTIAYGIDSAQPPGGLPGSSGSASVQTFEPVAEAVPEPSTAILLVFGVVLAIFWPWRSAGLHSD